MSQKALSPDTWDCHVHVLSPEKFPYRQDRTYTPYAATLAELVKASPAKGIVIVQASVEDGPDPLLHHLQEGRSLYPERIWRGAVITTTRQDRDVALFGKEYLNLLHEAGVRSIRIQSGYGSFGSDSQQLQDYIVRLAQSYSVASLGWSISIHQSLKGWMMMEEFLATRSDLQHVRFVAEHQGWATPSAYGTPEFGSMIRLMTTGRLWVKVSALHRRSPGDIYAMKQVISQIVTSRPDRIVWGTDWPHTNPAATGLEPQPPLEDVDTQAEIEAVQSWVGERDWEAMLAHNPAQLYQ